MRVVTHSTAAITPEDSTDALNNDNLLAPANASCCAQHLRTPCSYGADISTIPSHLRLVLNVPYSETKAISVRQTLSDRLTPLLISRGLVKGTTPKSIRKQLGAPIPVSALSPLDGSDVG